MTAASAVSPSTMSLCELEVVDEPRSSFGACRSCEVPKVAAAIVFAASGCSLADRREAAALLAAFRTDGDGLDVPDIVS